MSQYNISWASLGAQSIPGKSTISILEGTTDDTSTSLILTGKNVPLYGAIQQQNFIRLLEHFASDAVPSHATIGQLWYNTDPAYNALFFCVLAGTPNSHTFTDHTVNPNVTTNWVAVSNNALTATAIDAALGYTPVNKAGDTMAGPLVLSGDPTVSLGAATKQYVDAKATGFQVKPSVVMATTINLTATATSTTLTNSGTLGSFGVDGASGTLGARVLVKNQTTQTQNGIYTVTTVGDATTPWVLTRVAGTILAGDFTFVSGGTSQAGSSWIETTIGTGVNNALIIGIDPVVFQQFAGAASYSAGSGLALTGNIFSNTGIVSLTGSTNISVSSGSNPTISLTGTVPLASTALNATTATNATNIQVALTNANQNFSIPLVSNTTGYNQLNYDAGLLYNPFTSRLIANTFSGNLQGNATSATTAVTATNIAGGASGYLVYQASANTTALLGAGTAGQVLTMVAGNPTWATPSAPGLGTVTSVDLTAPSIFTVLGSPITSAGTINLTLSSQTQKTFFAAPISNNAAPSFRVIDPADLPTTITSNTTGNANTATSATSAGSANTANYAAKAGTVANGGTAGGQAMTFNWAGQNGQPAWLWGGNDGVNMYVYNPSNFSVNYATTAANVINGTGVGYSQSYSHPGRAVSVNYTNSGTKPIYVTFNGQGTGTTANGWTAYVNGLSAATIESSPGYSQGTMSFIVPPGAYYSIIHSGPGTGTIAYWSELS